MASDDSEREEEETKAETKGQMTQRHKRVSGRASEGEGSGGADPVNESELRIEGRREEGEGGAGL